MGFSSFGEVLRLLGESTGSGRFARAMDTKAFPSVKDDEYFLFLFLLLFLHFNIKGK